MGEVGGEMYRVKGSRALTGVLDALDKGGDVVDNETWYSKQEGQHAV